MQSYKPNKYNLELLAKTHLKAQDKNALPLQFRMHLFAEFKVAKIELYIVCAFF